MFIFFRTACRIMYHGMDYRESMFVVHQTGIGACRATDLWRTAMSDIGTPAYCCDKTGIMRPLGAPLAQKLACRCVQLTGWME